MVTIRPLSPEDWERVREIYKEGIATGHATFETSIPSWSVWDQGHLSSCRLVAGKAGQILGWAALSPVSGRCVYGGVAEVSVYVSKEARGQGVGTELLKALVQESEGDGIWTLQAGIFPENLGSLRIHDRAGFRQVGVRERLGQLNGRWRDVLLLERRSNSVGQD